MAAIDHVVFVAPDVEAGVRQIEASTGIRAVAGGAHEGRGTHNALLAFDDTTYLEIIGIDAAQPEPPKPRPFGITVQSRPHLATFAVHPTGEERLEDVVEILEAVGVEFREPEPMSRARPDGTVLSWRLSVPVGGDGMVPFVIDWGETPNPAASLPGLGPLRVLVVTHPDAAVREVVSFLDDRIRVGDGAAGLTAVVATAAGEYTLR